MVFLDTLQFAVYQWPTKNVDCSHFQNFSSAYNQFFFFQRTTVESSQAKRLHWTTKQRANGNFSCGASASSVETTMFLVPFVPDSVACSCTGSMKRDSICAIERSVLHIVYLGQSQIPHCTQHTFIQIIPKIFGVLTSGYKLFSVSTSQFSMRLATKKMYLFIFFVS